MGFVKLHREIKNGLMWNIKPEYLKVFLTILLYAEWKSVRRDFAGEVIELEPGQMVTGYQDLAEKSGKGVSLQNVRTAIDKLETNNIITKESTNEGTLITVKNWGKWQKTKKDLTSDLTSEQQSSNNRVTTNKEHKNVQEGKNSTVHSTRKIEDLSFKDAQKEIIQEIPEDVIDANKLWSLSGKWINTYGKEETVEVIKELSAKDKWSVIRESDKHNIGYIVEWLKNYEPDDDDEEQSNYEEWKELVNE
jgi:hypothetical protein